MGRPARRPARNLCRPSYWDAVVWIAENDNAGNGDNAQEITEYVSTLLVADLFGVSPEIVSADILRERDE